MTRWAFQQKKTPAKSCEKRQALKKSTRWRGKRSQPCPKTFADEAEPEILRHFGMTNPLELSGLFEGVGIIDKGVSEPYAYPNHVHLYRRAILAEWRSEPGLDLRQLITHVLVHEIGHHFGLSDEDMHAIEDAAEAD
jgi:predicted Zn-dependent protease with MMP-like domain